MPKKLSQITDFSTNRLYRGLRVVNQFCHLLIFKIVMVIKVVVSVIVRAKCRATRQISRARNC